uniref:N1876 protein n=1 Tax=Saccharomyces cerevisiae TaxID=4932 RepID=E9PAF5_YEASX|nr:N1876 [Saccharomyces cerevisiae]
MNKSLSYQSCFVLSLISKLSLNILAASSVLNGITISLSGFLSIFKSILSSRVSSSDPSLSDGYKHGYAMFVWKDLRGLGPSPKCINCGELGGEGAGVAICFSGTMSAIFRGFFDFGRGISRNWERDSDLSTSLGKPELGIL